MKARVHAPTPLLDAHEPPIFECLEVDLRIDGLQEFDLERFAQGQHTKRSPHAVVERAEASLDDLPKPRRGREAATQPPDATLAAEDLGLESAEHQLP
jgi:hypothetical protein